MLPLWNTQTAARIVAVYMFMYVGALLWVLIASNNDPLLTALDPAFATIVGLFTALMGVGYLLGEWVGFGGLETD